MLELILLLADMQAPVMCREGLELVNSLVRCMIMEDEIKQWGKRHLSNHDDDSVLLR